MRSRSIALSLVLVFLLSIAAPLAAMPRERDGSRWEDALQRFARFVQRVFAPITNGDGLIPPMP
ncbi:MAG TPA: hypothetical protein VNA69_13205 [Thermoanaerobaculia bacterium]|nr:hypothetical protein [Thermoanaerobaculia bacterium]